VILAPSSPVAQPTYKPLLLVPLLLRCHHGWSLKLKAHESERIQYILRVLDHLEAATATATATSSRTAPSTSLLQEAASASLHRKSSPADGAVWPPLDPPRDLCLSSASKPVGQSAC